MINLEVIETILMAPRACPIDLEPLRKMVELRRRRNISRRMTSRSLASTESTSTEALGAAKEGDGEGELDRRSTEEHLAAQGHGLHNEGRHAAKMAVLYVD